MSAHFQTDLKTLFWILFIFQLGLLACEKPVAPDQSSLPSPLPVSGPELYMDTSLSYGQLYDKMLGLLVGSAIGDAMGAPTEMWSREGILVEYGFVDGLDKVIREASPEGPWEFNLPEGGTTDDTRWKKLTIEYLFQIEEDRKRNQAPTLEAQPFAQLIIDEYLEGIESLKATDSFDPEPFENSARQMTWLQEWALVAKPFTENDL